MHLIQYVLGTDYLLRPLLMLLVLSAAAGVAGALVNLKRAEFRAEAMVHSVFPGIVGGFVWGGTESILVGASLAAVVTAAILTFRRSHSAHSAGEEAGTAVVLSSFYSLGIVAALYFSDKSGQLEALMFGRLLEMTEARFLQSVVLCLAALALLLLSWRSQVFLAFDPQAAAGAGIVGWRCELILNLAIAAVVVAGSSVVGVLLVVGFLVVPGAAARLVAPTSAAMVAWSVAVAALGSVVGMWWMLQSSSRPVSPQAAVSLALVGVFFLVLFARTVSRSVR
ncbi:iron chelate uptake ABC transporter family permease subunit [Corynebacterium sp. H128]|uniref:metal ABC transporter permease n=1 Tax=Corynebacterium sp. H128 TaxID=3133427 RepID=UPI0030A7035B